MPRPDKAVHVVRRNCMICGTATYLRVMSNDAGYYIGFYCPQCGPHSRESGYYSSREEARHALSTDSWNY